MSELSQDEILVRLESDKGARPAELLFPEGKGSKLSQP
jgi:hypothetical protein